MTQTILAVDDNENALKLLVDYLSEQNFRVVTASDGRLALGVLEAESADLILLDVMMPNLDGYQFIGRIRRTSSVPIIMVTAKRQEEDVIRGFELGADDYLIKPYRMRELLMRIRAVLRRSGERELSEIITIGDFTIDLQTRQVTVRGTAVDLTEAEYLLLNKLAESADSAVPRAKLSTALVQHSFSGTDSTLKIHIRNLRQKIEPDSASPVYIETVFGTGYRLRTDLRS